MQLVLQLRAAMLELVHAVIAGGFNLLLDADDLAVQHMILVELASKMGVMRLEFMDGVPQFGKFKDEWMMEIGGL